MSDDNGGFDYCDHEWVEDIFEDGTGRPISKKCTKCHERLGWS